MSDRIVIVTGAGRGIGRSIAGRFAAEGCAVVAVARNARELDETAKLIEQAGGRCRARVGDVSSASEVERIVAETVDHFGRIDVLVNNAGVAPLAMVESMALETYRQCNGVNIDAVFYACKAVWGAMRQQGGGTIINISSRAAIDPFAGFGTYGAAKAWVVAFTRGLAEEGRPHNIRVFGVGPGAVETSMLRAPFPDFPADRCLQPEEVAEVVFLMTTPACYHATGQTLFISK